MRVIHKTNFGGCVVAHGTERIAIDGATAKHIVVKAVSADSTANNLPIPVVNTMAVSDEAINRIAA